MVDEGTEDSRFEALGPASGSGSPDLDEESLGVGDERAISLDLAMQVVEALAVGLDAEARDRPDHLAEEPHDGADIVEDGAQ